MVRVRRTRGHRHVGLDRSSTDDEVLNMDSETRDVVRDRDLLKKVQSAVANPESDCGTWHEDMVLKAAGRCDLRQGEAQDFVRNIQSSELLQCILTCDSAYNQPSRIVTSSFLIAPERLATTLWPTKLALHDQLSPP